MNMKRLIIAVLFATTALGIQAQSLLYPKHFDLQEVTLAEGPMKTAMDKNIELLLKYDVDRLLTPFVRQTGLASTTDKSSKYYQWLTKHPNFENWGGGGFDLSGHVGGHYLTALALAYAACHDEVVREKLKSRLDYMLDVMKDCQDCYDGDTSGLYGFIGGQPINDSWKALYKGDLSKIRQNWGWVPFYCQHKILAGLRDAYVYGVSDTAKELFRKLADWSVNVVKNVSEADFQAFLGCEHGGMNETLLDAYQLFGDKKYLTAAKKYSHKDMINGMQSLNTTFLDGKHANTQVPKYIGFERIYELDNTTTTYRKATENFWTDVASNRTVCIGGNSVAEHFLAKNKSNSYIDHLDGPESCNSNNMLKLSEMLSDRTSDAKYADFYEQTMWNHILSTQDPTTGGYVYFTTLRPQGYRVYSTVNQGMWCCVGTGMENHSKYGHFIYTHDGTETLYVNLFTPSKLANKDFIIKQETKFPESNTTELTIGKAGHYTVAFRHPQWAGKEFEWSVNGEKKLHQVDHGKAYYVTETRDWQVGDKITIFLDMQLRYETCPNYTDYIAFKYGPILLAAQTSDGEKLQNEYAGAGRMDHAPSCVASSKKLTTAPLLIGEREDVLNRIERLRCEDNRCEGLRFIIDVSRPGIDSYQWTTLTLQPFYQIHHARYSCYWYQQTEENFKNSSMAADENAAAALAERTIDFVAPGEQQSEAGHEYNYSSDSSTGNYNGEAYRDARANGYIQYSLFNPNGIKDSLAIMLRFTTADKGRKGYLTVDGTRIADITVAESVKNAENGFYNIEFPIPAALAIDENGHAKEKFVVRLTASPTTLIPGLYYMRLMSGYEENLDSYKFVANQWTTGDEGRVSASNVTYDTQKNIIHVNAGTGANNVALMFSGNNLDYTIAKTQKYLVVRGTNLKTSSGASYLWWLNGTNKGSQVAPTTVKTVAIDGQSQQVIAWDMTQSGLYDNFSGDRPSICQGMTIFGLTSTTGKSDILDINFTDDVEQYVTLTTGISTPTPAPKSRDGFYTLGGIKGTSNHRGIYLSNGKKITK
jgi:hypothetical protein